MNGLSQDNFKKIFAGMLALVFIVQFFAFTPLAFAQDPNAPGDENATRKHACAPTSTIIGDIPDFTCGMLDIADAFVNAILEYILGGVESVAATLIKVNTYDLTTSPVVLVGWTQTRNIANIFFVFILLWIALATIFDIPEYSAKRLLPRFIIAALLINFSLPIGQTVVSLGNNFAAIFYKEKSISGALGTIGSGAYKTVYLDKVTLTPEPASKLPQDVVDTIERQTVRLYTIEGATRTVTYSECKALKLTPGGATPRTKEDATRDIACSQMEGVAKALQDKYTLNPADTSARFYKTYGSQIVAKLFIGILAIFVMSALCVMLVIRYITLIFVLILGPFAFLGMILPKTQSWWDDWWRALIKWTFFFPAFAIFLDLTIKTVTALNAQYITPEQNANAGFFTMLFQQLLAGSMLIGSLMAAQKMGIETANTAMTLGKRSLVNMKDYAKQRGQSYGTRGLGVLGSGALAVGAGRIPLVRGMAARMAAAGTKESERETQKKTGWQKNLTAKDRANYMANLSGENEASTLEKMDKKTREGTLSAMSYKDKMRILPKLRTANAEHFLAQDSDPRVVAHALNPNLDENKDSNGFQVELNNIINTKFSGKNAKNLSSHFIESERGKIWAKEGMTPDQMSAITNTSTDRLKSLQTALTEEIDGVTGELKKVKIDPSQFKGVGMTEFLQSTAARAFVERGQQIPAGYTSAKEKEVAIAKIQTATAKAIEDARLTAEEKSFKSKYEKELSRLEKGEPLPSPKSVYEKAKGIAKEHSYKVGEETAEKTSVKLEAVMKNKIKDINRPSETQEEKEDIKKIIEDALRKEKENT